MYYVYWFQTEVNGGWRELTTMLINSNLSCDLWKNSLFSVSRDILDESYIQGWTENIAEFKFIKLKRNMLFIYLCLKVYESKWKNS